MRSVWYIPVLIAVGIVAVSSCRDPDIDESRARPEPVSPTSSAALEPQEKDVATTSAGLASMDSPHCRAPSSKGISTRPLVPGAHFEHPVQVAQPPGDDDTLFVVERSGRVILVAQGRVLRKPFLDIRRYLDASHPERGLIGLVFHPDYPKNGRFYLNYTPGGQSRNVIAEWGLRFGEPEERRRLVEVDDPQPGNNGGAVEFGPDGLLYVGLGDGGGKGDPHGIFGHAQDNSTLLGSILRMDVDADTDIAARDNPFVGKVGEDLIWAMGVRNPWRFSFDEGTGVLFVADRGESRYEEISIITPEHASPLNLGWRAYEGFHVRDDDLTDLFAHHHEPALVYSHQSKSDVVRNGCAIVGGYLYRGDALSGLRGVYIYGDRCSQDVAGFSYCDGKIRGHRRLPELSEQGVGLTSFGQDNAGELYMTFSDGQVRKLVME